MKTCLHRTRRGVYRRTNGTGQRGTAEESVDETRANSINNNNNNDRIIRTVPYLHKRCYKRPWP